MPQKVYIAAGCWIRCVLGGEGASRPLPPNPPTPAETKPSQARPSQFKGRPVYLPSPPAESPEFPTLSVAKPTRSDSSRAGPLSLQTIFFQGDHVYESAPSLFRARNPSPRYLYLTQRVPSRVCSRRRSHVHTVPSLHRHKQNATKVAHRNRPFDQVKPHPPPQPPTPAETKPSQASLKAALFISQAPRLNLPNSPPSLWPSQPDPTPAEPGRCF